MQLMALTVQMYGEITQDMCYYMIMNIAVHVSETAQQISGHGDHVIQVG